MKGMIMDYQLTMPKILQRAVKLFPDKEIVSLVDGVKTTASWGELYPRVMRLMNVLRKLGVKPGDRVATFAWNHQRHLELYFAIPCLGAVLHTLNIRLFPDQLSYIVNHAEDTIIFVDDSLLEPIEQLAPRFKTVGDYVIISGQAELPETTLSAVHHYEKLMAAAEEAEDFPDISETDAAGLCYTSGTTGDPRQGIAKYNSRCLWWFHANWE